VQNPIWAQTTSGNQPIYEGVNAKAGENNFAFLIFNSEYNKGVSPVTDAVENRQGILALLSGLAFPDENIFILENPSKSDIEDEIYEFSRKLSTKANLLVYYNGHSINFTDTPENEILLTSFKLPRSNDLFLLERRVSRSSMSLEAMIAEFTPKRVGQITVLFDACNNHFVELVDDAEHWDVFNRTACAASVIPGADIFYAGTQTGTGSLVNALTAIISQNPTIDLQALERELSQYAPIGAQDQTGTSKKPTLVAGARSGDPAGVCLVKALVDGNLVCNAKPVVVEEDVVTADVSDEAPDVTASVEKKTPKKGVAMRDAWAAAKRSGTCKPYREFVEDYPNAIFKAKAERAISVFCGPEKKKKVVIADAVTPLAKDTETPKPAEETPAVVVENVDKKDQPAKTQAASVEKKAPKPGAAMRDDWATAKRSGTCKPYREFVKNYPDTVFIAKAERAVSIFCGPEIKEPAADTKVVKNATEPTAEQPGKDEDEAENTGDETQEPEIKTVQQSDVTPDSSKAEQVASTPDANENPDVVIKTPAPKKNIFKDWISAKKVNTCESYRGYIVDHKDTVFALKAQEKADELCVGVPLKKEEPPKKVVVAEVEDPPKKEEPPKQVVVAETEEVLPSVALDDENIEGAQTIAIPSVQYTANAVVKVRSGPGADYPEIATLTEDQQVIVVKSIRLSTGKTWLKVKKGERIGYVSSVSLTELAKVSAAQEVPPVKEPLAAPEPKVEQTQELKPEPADKPVVVLSASQMWLVARSANSCKAYNVFLEKHPKSLFSAKAKRAVNQKCSDADAPVVVKPSPEEPTIAVLDEKPDNLLCTGGTPTIYMTKTKVPVLATPNGSVLFSYDINVSVSVVNEHDDNLIIRVGPSNGDFKCGYIKNDKVALQKLDDKVVSQQGSDVDEPDISTATDSSGDTSEKALNNRYALVIINEEYTSGLGPPAGVTDDKDAFLAIIDKLNYPKENVKVLLNTKKNDLENAVFEFALNMKPNSDLLFYYSGYGITSLSGKTNFILPADFVVPENKQTSLSRRRFKQNSIDLKTLIKDLGQNDTKQITVIYNACNDLPLPEEKNAPYWLFLKPTPCSAVEIDGASIFYPVKDGQFSITGLGEKDQDKRSLFMRVLEDTLVKNPAMEILELQKELAWSVAALANKRTEAPKVQDPVFKDGYRVDKENPQKRCLTRVMVNGKLTCTGLEGVEGDTIKITKTDPAPVTPEQVITTRLSWFETKQLNTCEAYQDFKENFANSIYSIKVEQNIKDKCSKPEEEVLVDPPEQIEEQEEAVVLPDTCQATGDDAVPFELTRLGHKALQSQLNRLGCNVGAADGDWGRNSQRGFDRFKKLIKLDENPVKPNCANLEQIKALPTKRICPLICGRGFEKVGEKCVAIKPVATVNTTTTTPATKKAFVAREKIKKREENKQATAVKKPAPVVKKPAPKVVKAVPVTKGTCRKNQVLRSGRCISKGFLSVK
jgi:hypothetical protein